MKKQVKMKEVREMESVVKMERVWEMRKVRNDVFLCQVQEKVFHLWVGRSTKGRFQENSASICPSVYARYKFINGGALRQS